MWNGALWLILGGLFAPLVPGGWRTIAALALLLLFPLLVLARGFAGGVYPAALTRVWVYRPFWYGQLFLPFLAAAGLVGVLAGLPFGAAQRSGRWAVARAVDLTLSGHTHHGQLAVPRLGWSMASVFLDLSMGMYRSGDAILYINPGTNFWGIPFRVGALPEVTVVTLRRSESGPATAH